MFIIPEVRTYMLKVIGKDWCEWKLWFLGEFEQGLEKMFRVWEQRVEGSLKLAIVFIISFRYLLILQLSSGKLHRLLICPPSVINHSTCLSKHWEDVFQGSKTSSFVLIKFKDQRSKWAAEKVEATGGSPVSFSPSYSVLKLFVS